MGYNSNYDSYNTNYQSPQIVSYATNEAQATFYRKTYSHVAMNGTFGIYSCRSYFAKCSTRKPYHLYGKWQMGMAIDFRRLLVRLNPCQQMDASTR